ncbi:MAG: LpqB family beta-propeller domain-containing protein, partial [Gemmatimonadota bacterium]
TPVEIVAADFAVVPVRLILAPGDLDTLIALVPGQSNRELRTGLQWRSAAPEIVRVGPTGIVQALAPGETEIIVSGFLQERRLTVRVHPPVQTLVVSPKPGAGVLRVPLHGTRALTVRAEAADSTPVPEAALWWEVADTAIASFDPAHAEITAHRLGTTSVTLRARGFDPVTWVVEVIPGGIAIDHQAMALVLGTRNALKANLVDDNGASIGPADDLQWSTSNINVAVVGNDGMIEATGLGRATIVAATRWGRADTTVILVTGDLIFSANRGGPTFGIYQLSLRDPSRVVPLLADSFQNVQAVPSPDRGTIAFSSNRGGDFDLYLMDPDGTNLRRITSGLGADGDPAWTPDGSHLVFTSARSGSSQIYSMATDGTGLRPLTTAGGGNSAPAVSPDGRTIVFVSGRDGNDEIYRMDIDGGNQTNLSATREREAAPRFLASGDLAYAAEVRRNGYQILRVPSDGTPAIVLATSPTAITSFAISAAGDRLAIVAGRVTDPRRGRAEFTFSIQSLAGGAVFQVPLMLNEQIVNPHF